MRLWSHINENYVISVKGCQNFSNGIYAQLWKFITSEGFMGWMATSDSFIEEQSCFFMLNPSAFKLVDF